MPKEMLHFNLGFLPCRSLSERCSKVVAQNGTSGYVDKVLVTILKKVLHLFYQLVLNVKVVQQGSKECCLKVDCCKNQTRLNC